MRLILSFLILSMFSFVQQDCHKDKATSAGKTETATANMNSVPAVSPAATPFPEEAARVSLADAKKAFDTGGALFVDTRPADAYKTEHIKGAINIPAGEFETRFGEVANAKKIIAYCS